MLELAKFVKTRADFRKWIERKIIMDKDIMNVTVNNLAQKQLDFLKFHTVCVLKEIIDLVENEKFDEIEKKLIYSDGGDWGEDNYYINFGYDDGDYKDMDDIVCTMKQVKEIVEQTKQQEEEKKTKWKK